MPTPGSEPEASGLLLLDKPAGFTSHDCVALVRRAYGRAKTGHAGTLDPAATGLLVMAIGRGTRLLEYVSGCCKVYLGEIVCGVRTDTHDAEGAVQAVQDASFVSQARVAAALARQRGQLAQIPPMYSAKQVDGQRLYDLARRGEVVERQPVPVTVESLELVGFQAGCQPVARVAVRCSAGCYIRSIARDLGAELGCGAHLRRLRRLAQGRFSLSDAVDLASLRALPREALLGRLLPLSAAVADLPQVTVPEAEGWLLATGQPIAAPGDLAEQSLVVAALADGRCLGVCAVEDGCLQPRKMLLSPDGLARPDPPASQ